MSNVVEKEKKNTSGFTPEIVKENMCHFMDNENLSIANMQMIAGTATVQAVYYWMKGERVPSIDGPIFIAKTASKIVKRAFPLNEKGNAPVPNF